MARVDILAKFILSWEGGYICHAKDRGGATNMGVTLKTWRSCGYDKTGDGEIGVDDLKLLTEQEVVDVVLKPHYWDRCRADEIQNQWVANVIVDWVWASGVWGIKYTQEVLGVKSDGIVGDITLGAINEAEPLELYVKLWHRREKHIRAIVENDESQQVFLKGWLRRLSGLGYERMGCNR